MIKRWMAFVLFGLGIVSGPVAFHFGDLFLTSAGADDAPLLVIESPWVTGDMKVKPVTSTSSQTATWDGYTLSFDRNGAATLQRHEFHAGDCPVSGGKYNFTESVKFLHGAFYSNAMSPTWNTPGLFNAAGISPIVANAAASDVLPCYQIKCCQVIGGGVERSSVSSVGGSDGCDIDCQAGAATNLVVSDANTAFGTISFVRGTGYGIVLTANTIENTEAQPSNVDECSANLTAKFIELSQELAKRKLQRLSPRELAQKIEELEQEIANDEAFSKLDEARKHLKDLMNKHPDSSAAQSAKRMLEADCGTPGAPVLQPTPDNLLPTY